MTMWLLFITLGIFAGALSGLIGIGGGLIIVPALVLLFGFSQKMAQGTTLALLVPPIGIVAALAYYREGYVNLTAAICIVIGFVLGSLLVARFIGHVPTAALTRIFAVFMVLAAIRLFLSAGK